MHSTNKILTLILTASLSLGLASNSVAREEKVLNVYNWFDYIAPDTIANFEKETGIKVRYDNFESEEELIAKLQSGQSDYDIVVPASDWAKPQIDKGLLQKLDKTKLSNLNNIDANIRKRLREADPENNYLVAYLWGYTSMGVNVDAVIKNLGKTPIPANLWDLVFNPTYTSKLKSCGITFLDSVGDIMPIALNYIGKPPYSNKPEDYALATQMLKKIRPDIKAFTSVGQPDLLVNNSTCVIIGWGADIYRARAMAKEKKILFNIAPAVPKSGALLFIDSLAIPKNAKHSNNAHLFINYILRPEVHANITNFTKFANPNTASKPFMLRDIETDRALFPLQSDLDRLITPKTLDPKIIPIRQDYFNQFKEKH